MSTLRNKIVWLLLILSVAILPGAFIECDLEDGYLSVDLEDLDIDWGHGHYYDDCDDWDDCHDDWGFDIWIEEW